VNFIVYSVDRVHTSVQAPAAGTPQGLSYGFTSFTTAGTCPTYQGTQELHEELKRKGLTVVELYKQQTNKQRSTDNRELSRLNHARARKRTQSPTPGGRGSVSPRLASGAHRWSAPPRAALTLGVVRSMSVPHCALGAAGDPGVPLPWLSSSFLAARVARVCESRELPPARRRVSLRSRRAPLA
jgi:hypothetical protein